ncbi:hypothetical protein DSM112329_02185 [Paraconexibacter sp. AEG42_29]|uniref:EAL domain-containing protein n=1 Tax=Paraconexibacter sp. AEG42_29 TaxID=2997339 RepID=A0AAU7AUL1_9ACTN
MRQLQETRALLVAEDPATARHITALLTAGGEPYARTVADVVCAGSGAAALDVLQAESFAVVFVCVEPGEPRGLELLDSVRILAGGTPLLVWADAPTDELRRQAMGHGVSAVVDGSSTGADDLAVVVVGAIAAAGFESATRDALRSARKAAVDVTVLQLHVSGRDSVTRDWSAAERATLVAAVHERLEGRLAAGDVLLDLGDGRHGILATDTGHEAEARGLAQELVQALERPVRVGGERVALTATCGWVLAPVDAPTAEVAVRRSAPQVAVPVDRATAVRAETTAIAVAAARETDDRRAGPGSGTHRGGPRIREAVSQIRPMTVAEAVAATTPPAAAVDPTPAPGPRRGFARRLRAAIARGELVLHYQPIVRLGDDTIPVVEALVRWKLPTADGSARFLPPAEFIPLAEETGAIEEIGAFALSEACRQLREWDDRGLAPVRVAVNLSARELCSPELPARVADALAESGVSADRLELELTESMFADPEGTAKMLRRLRALGVRVAIDDFGTGYSSLGYLTRFAVDVIKVDGAFVRRAADDHDAAEVVRAIVAIAHQLDLEVVAEGVETTEQLRFVQGENVDLVQGFLFCEPLPAEAAGAWLAWAEDVVAQERPVRRPRRVRLTRREQAIRGGSLAAGAIAGAAVALPVQMPAASACPASGEGLVFCEWQHGYAPAFTLFMIVLTVVFVAIDLARRTPALVRAWRDPVARERRARRTLPDAAADPLLLAATWGVSAPPNTVAAATALPVVVESAAEDGVEVPVGAGAGAGSAQAA